MFDWFTTKWGRLKLRPKLVEGIKKMQITKDTPILSIMKKTKFHSGIKS